MPKSSLVYSNGSVQEEARVVEKDLRSDYDVGAVAGIDQVAFKSSGRESVVLFDR